MRSRTIKIIVTWICTWLMCVSLQAQEVDYRMLKKGDVLPDGDSIVFKKKIGASSDLDMWRFFVYKADTKLFSTIVVAGDMIKEYTADVEVNEKFGTIIESYTNGEIIIYDKKWKETGRLNVMRDYGWEENWTEAGLSPVYPYLLSQKYILIHQQHEVLVIDNMGEIVFRRDSILTDLCDRLDFSTVQYLDAGKVFITVHCSDFSQGYFLLLQADLFSVIAQSSTTGLFPTESRNNNYKYVYCSGDSENLYILKGRSVLITDMQQSFVSTIEGLFPLRLYDLVEVNDEVIFFSHLEERLKRYRIRTGELTGEVILSEIPEKPSNLSFQFKYIVKPQAIFLLVGNHNNKQESEYKELGLLEIGIDLTEVHYHPLPDIKIINDIDWNIVAEQVGIIK